MTTNFNLYYKSDTITIDIEDDKFLSESEFVELIKNEFCKGFKITVNELLDGEENIRNYYRTIYRKKIREEKIKKLLHVV